jgi:hypothetical protein
MTIAAGASARPLASDATRWGQLIFGIICMVMIANLQYGWICSSIQLIRSTTGGARPSKWRSPFSS